jgi:Holliday junction resolvase RusA-like endonuclease
VSAQIYRTFIAMEPRGKQRPRIVRRPNMPYPVAITPDETVQAENRIQHHVAGEWQPRPPYEGPLQIQIVVRIMKPKSKPKKVIYPTGIPDADNYAKLLLDALNGVVWRDDSQVVRLFVEKAYCTTERPHQGFALTVHALDQDLEVI